MDGLRAIAVLSVIGFHAFPDLFSGGFVGVDIFFVISGYLISGILFHSLEAGKFRYVDFYQRRVRRIFPALLVVLAASLIFGWFWLLPDEYAQLGLHTGASSFFVQNLALWKESGYFDTAAELKPLLHIWSLGVEEQFYLFYPLCIVFFWKRGRGLAGLIVTLAIASCAWNILKLPEDRVAAFFLPQMRLWELLVGGIICRFEDSNRKKLVAHALGRKEEHPTISKPMFVLRECASVVGILLIGYAWFAFDRSTPFPGVNALFPVVGAGLIISLGRGSFLNRRVFALKPLEWLGLLSYPLYLWHWVVLAYARILIGQEPILPLKISLLIGSLFLAWLTYEFIELPLRFGSTSKTTWARFKTMALGLGITLVGLTGLSIKYSGGVPNRKIADEGEAAVLGRIKIDEGIRHAFPLAGCDYDSNIERTVTRFCASFGDQKAPRTIVVWGDSHSEAWAPAFYEIGREIGARVIVFSHRGCAPLIGTRRTDGVSDAKNCERFALANDVLASIQKLKPSHVFLVARWSLYNYGWLVQGTLQQATHYLITTEDGTATRETSQKALNEKIPATILALSEVAPLTVIRTVPVLKTYIDVGMSRAKDRFEPTAFSHREFERFTDEIINRGIQEARTRGKFVDAIDPAELLCDKQKCHAMLNMTVVYSDDNHLTAQGAFLFKGLIREQLNEAD